MESNQDNSDSAQTAGISTLIAAFCAICGGKVLNKKFERNDNNIYFKIEQLVDIMVHLAVMAAKVSLEEAYVKNILIHAGKLNENYRILSIIIIEKNNYAFISWK
jgi:hypothetical protein